MKYIELSYYNCNQHVIFSFIFTILWMFIILALATLYFRRDLSNIYDICDPITMIYFDKRACYKKITKTIKTNPLFKEKTTELGARFEKDGDRLNELASKANGIQDNLFQVVKNIQNSIMNIKSTSIDVYDKITKNLDNLQTQYDEKNRDLTKFITSLPTSASKFLKDYNKISISGTAKKTDAANKTERYLKNTYNAIQDVMNDNQDFFKQYIPTFNIKNYPKLK